MHYIITFVFRVPLQFIIESNNEDTKEINNYFYINFVDDIEDPEKDQSDATHYL